jgi:NADPH2:quinone reductase
MKKTVSGDIASNKSTNLIKAVVVRQNGAPDVLITEHVELKYPGEGQALVRLKMAGVNFVDIYQRRGFQSIPLPFTMGFEGAGIVEQVGPGVTAVHTGDRVAFARQQGAYAEAIVLDAERLIPIPEDISFEEAAAFPLQGMTAHYLIHEFRKPCPGDVVLIHAAAGGIGLLLVQWARHLGATVIGTVSALAKTEVVLDAGANHVINYTTQNFAEETKRLTKGQGADLIIDSVGQATFAGNLDAAAIRAHIVIFGAASGVAEPVSPNDLMSKSLSVSGGDLQHFITERNELLRRSNDVLNGIRNGWLKLNISKIFALEEAALAHELMESRQTTGKLLIAINK